MSVTGVIMSGRREKGPQQIAIEITKHTRTHRTDEAFAEIKSMYDISLNMFVSRTAFTSVWTFSRLFIYFVAGCRRPGRGFEAEQGQERKKNKEIHVLEFKLLSADKIFFATAHSKSAVLFMILFTIFFFFRRRNDVPPLLPRALPPPCLKEKQAVLLCIHSYVQYGT